MRLVFSEGKQKEFLTKFKELKNISWREFGRNLDIDWQSIRDYRDEKITLPKKIFEKILVEKPSLENYSKFIEEERDSNWGRAKGGRKSWIQIRKKLKYDKNFRKMWIKNCVAGGKKRVKMGPIEGWENGFRNSPRRIVIGPKGERMFSSIEQSVAKLFLQIGLPYQYEPLMIVNKNKYFPDFVIDKKIIVEIFGYSSEKYFQRMKKKLKDYRTLNKKIILIIPNKMNSIYKKRVRFSKKFVKLVVSRDLNEVNQYILEFIGVN
jgi:hypothetical protein